MYTYSDPSMVSSNFDRNERDLYCTEPWVTRALLHALYKQGLANFTHIWEPACGRGDMVQALCDTHCYIAASDIDISLYEGSDGYQQDFLKTNRLPPLMRELNPLEIAIITNPPYKLAKEFVEHALGRDVGLVAMLMRGEWKYAKSRTHLFTQKVSNKQFALEVILTSRPRWDNWRDKPKPDKSPRHNYSWFCWVDNWEKPPYMCWESKI